VADRERRMTPPYGGVFVARTTILDSSGVHRALTRVSHEIIERNEGLDDVVVVGLQTGGVQIALRIVRLLFERNKEEEIPVSVRLSGSLPD